MTRPWIATTLIAAAVAVAALAAQGTKTGSPEQNLAIERRVRHKRTLSAGALTCSGRSSRGSRLRKSRLFPWSWSLPVDVSGADRVSERAAR